MDGISADLNLQACLINLCLITDFKAELHQKPLIRVRGYVDTYHPNFSNSLSSTGNVGKFFWRVWINEKKIKSIVVKCCIRRKREF